MHSELLEHDSRTKLIITDKFSLGMITSDCVFAMRSLDLEATSRRVRDALFEEQPARNVIGGLFDQYVVELLNETRSFGMSFTLRSGITETMRFERECVLVSGDVLLVVERFKHLHRSELTADSLRFRELTVELDERLLLSEQVVVSEYAHVGH
jgi:hypothetical protein